MQLPTPTLYIITSFIFAISLTVLVIDSTLLSWVSQTKSPSSNPNVSISTDPSNPSNDNTYVVSSLPSQYNPAGLILNLVSGAGGTIDGILLIICLLSIDRIYRAQNPRFALVSKPAAERGQTPIWLWAVTLFIALFSVARSLVGFIGCFVAYYTSTTLVLPPAPSYPELLRDAENRYIAPDNGAFAFGAWVCQLEDVMVGDRTPGDGSRRTVGNSEVGKLCSLEKAGRGLSVVLVVLYVVLTGLLVARYMSEMRERKEVSRGVEDGKAGVM